MCDKRRFATEKDAQAELVGTVIARNRGKTKRRECRHYFCPPCGAWHLTSLPKWVEGSSSLS